MPEKPRIGSLFSGYGGLDMAVAAHYGGRVVWHCEIDPWPARILAARWPDAPNLGDITAVDWAAVPAIDILTGGFPCQDLSHAGKRLGLKPGTRSGLWEHMAYAIDQLRPQRVVIENVRGLLTGAAHSDVEPCPWCVGDAGGEPALRALGAVCGDLADLGYDARWGTVAAADAGAPHRRERVFIVARNPAG
jgi:DNA (cytosine-5)-methyltransferase 1